jgi:hypothetical protein
MKKFFVYSLSLIALTACSEIPREAYYDRGVPESLLDVSSEVVNFNLDSEQSVSNVSEWVAQDLPTRAEVYCLESDPTCLETVSVLEQYGVPVLFVAASDNSVALIYERVLSRDCDNRYIDNPYNPYNLNHPTFGCSMASNMVQMVSDKRQFVSPELKDFHDAEKTIQVFDQYLVSPVNESSGNESLLDSINLD